jgi:hypothetical protein
MMSRQRQFDLTATRCLDKASVITEPGLLYATERDIDMADPPPYPGTSISDGTGTPPGSRPGGGRSRWKTAAVWVVVIALLLVLVILHLTGVVGAGTNG